jgi:hypothetical protein
VPPGRGTARVAQRLEDVFLIGEIAEHLGDDDVGARLTSSERWGTKAAVDARAHPGEPSAGPGSYSHTSRAPSSRAKNASTPVPAPISATVLCPGRMARANAARKAS